MNGLLALIEREKIPSLTIRERSDYALQTLSHRGSLAKEVLLFDEKKTLDLHNPDELALFALASCFSEENKEKYVAKRGNKWLIFGGQLFNRTKLSETILSRNPNANYRFDADIAIELFIKEEANAFALLEGYWSLIVADLDKQMLFAARDHFGNRPLYYCKSDTQFGIASESRALCSALKNAGEINKNAVFDFLLWGDSGKHQQNFFSHIHELNPSHYLSYSLINNTFDEKSYYILPYKNCKAGYNEYAEPFHIDKTRQLVLDSVQNNIKGKDKMAVGFSGGIESAALLGCAKKLNPDLQIVAFTAANFYDESDTLWAEKIIKHTNAKWINVVPDTKQIINQLQEVNKVQNIPIFGLRSVAQYIIMATAKQHGFDEMMGGQGADELFAGYTAYFLPFLKSLRNQWMFKDWANELITISNSGISYKEIASQKWNDWAKKTYYNKERLAKKTKSQELVFLNKEYQNYSCSDNGIANKSVLNDYLYESQTLYLPYIIHWEEHAAASFGMESLMPFANSKTLTECVFSIPSTFKIHNGWTKYLLRSAMVGIVPDEIRWRKQNVGFYVTEKKWLSEMGDEMKKHIYQLDDSDHFMDKNSLLDAWKKVYHSDNLHFQQFVFRYYSYLLWRNEFFNKF